MTDLDISPAFIATLSTVASIVLTVSKLFVGITYDKWGLRVALLMCQIAAFVTFVLNGLLTNSSVSLVLAMAATILSSLSLPLETVMLPLNGNDPVWLRGSLNS